MGLQRRPAFGALVPCTQLLLIASAWMSQRPLKPTCPKQSSRVSPSQTKHTSESFSASNSSSSANEHPPARPFPKTLGASRSLARSPPSRRRTRRELCGFHLRSACRSRVPAEPLRHHARPHHRRRPRRPLPCSCSFSSPIHFPHSGDVLGGRHEAAFLTPPPGTTQTFPRHSRKARGPLRPRSPCTTWLPVPRDPASCPPRPRQQALTPRPPAWPMTKRPPLLLGRPRLDCSPPAPGPGQLSPWRSLQHTTPVCLLVCLLTSCHSRPNLSPETTGCVRLAPRHVPAPASGAACPRPRSGRGARPRGDGGPCHGGARGAPRPLSGRSHAARLRGRGHVVSLYLGPSNQRQHRPLSTLCDSTSSSAQRDWNRTRCVAATRVKRVTLPKCSGRRLVLCKHSASTC